jgi:hypothetical protein
LATEHRRYQNKQDKNEIRAERITVDGKTTELR